ncbi:MAG: cytochrome C [Deltaproteobacteria bacterium]|nr:MAG: cytochrome C [Deltaproteobacteria bacterium]
MMKKGLLLVSAGVCLGLILSLAGVEMVEHTSGVRFCSMCHSMKGVAEAYKNDVHGGSNKYGVKAKCVDCHLPHDNVFVYITAKAYTGIKDVVGEIFWADSFDWEGNLKNREHFTYTSGCLTCHNLDDIKYDIPKAFLAHKDFKTGKVDSCVRCHQHVGHKNIKAHLSNQGKRR